MSVLKRGSESWKTTERDKKKRDTFKNRCMRQIGRIKWPEMITNEEIEKQKHKNK